MHTKCQSLPADDLKQGQAVFLSFFVLPLLLIESLNEVSLGLDTLTRLGDETAVGLETPDDRGDD